jgi:purine-binding chemotaxis protein CheW
MGSLVVFALSDLRCALQLSDIDRILRAVETSPVPKAPQIVIGLINVQGCIVPVLNIRKLLHLPEIEMTLNDRIIIARTIRFPIAILVDYVQGVVEFNEQEIIAPEKLYPGIEFLDGVTMLKGDIIYIYNLNKFLSLEEEEGIEHLLTGGIPMPADQET